jgi:GNAT superfamily N-acetyltransferase
VPRGGRLWRDCQGRKNGRAFKEEIEAGAAHGSLAFHNEECVGWCRYGPTASFPRLHNSPSLNSAPPRGTWSIVCFYVPAGWRGRGVATVLLRHALEVMKKRGARLIEAYPVPKHAFGSGKLPPAFAWTGVQEMFLDAGFRRHGHTRVKRQICRLPIR